MNTKQVKTPSNAKGKAAVRAAAKRVAGNATLPETPSVTLPKSRNGNGAKHSRKASVRKTPKSLTPKTGEGAIPRLSEGELILAMPSMYKTVNDETNDGGKMKYAGKVFSECLKRIRASLGLGDAARLPDKVFEALRNVARIHQRTMFELPAHITTVNPKSSVRPTLAITDNDRKGFTYGHHRSAVELANDKRKAQSATDMSYKMREQAKSICERYDKERDEHGETDVSVKLYLAAKKLRARYAKIEALAQHLAETNSVKPHFPPLEFEGGINLAFMREAEAIAEAKAALQAEAKSKNASHDKKHKESVSVGKAVSEANAHLRNPANDIPSFSASDANSVANLQGQLDEMKQAMLQLVKLVTGNKK